MSDETLHQDGIGHPDELDRLWTPHRMAYIRGENKPADGGSDFRLLAKDGIKPHLAGQIRPAE